MRYYNYYFLIVSYVHGLREGGLDNERDRESEMMMMINEK